MGTSQMLWRRAVPLGVVFGVAAALGGRFVFEPEQARYVGLFAATATTGWFLAAPGAPPPTKGRRFASAVGMGILSVLGLAGVEIISPF